MADNDVPDEAGDEYEELADDQNIDAAAAGGEGPPKAKRAKRTQLELREIRLEQILAKFDWLDKTEDWRVKYLEQGTMRCTFCKVSLSIDRHVKNLDIHANTKA